MGNLLLALQALGLILEQAQAVNALIQEAQASGQDITADQLAQLSSDYQTAVTQLNADIAAAKAAGK